MPPIIRNVLAVLAGLLIGGFVNGSIISLSPRLIPPPDGVDVNNAESLAKSMHLFRPVNFVMPFLAHALGTLAGAIVAYLFATTHRERLAYAVGAVFLCGGIAACFMIPAPAWFMVLDLVGAYLPMAWLGIAIGRRAAPTSSMAGPNAP